MHLAAGDKIGLSLEGDYRQHDGVVVSVDGQDLDVRLEPWPTFDPEPAQGGRCMILAPGQPQACAELTALEPGLLRLRILWSEKRGAFRIDDVMPVMARRVDTAVPPVARILSGTITSALDQGLFDDSLNHKLLEALEDINSKLNTVINLLYLSGEGLMQAEKQLVSLSATGMRLTLGEKCAVKDAVEVKLLLPLVPPTGLLLYGSVTRVRELPAGGFETALQFFDMDDEIRNTIVRHCINAQRRMIRSRRPLLG